MDDGKVDNGEAEGQSITQMMGRMVTVLDKMLGKMERWEEREERKKERKRGEKGKEERRNETKDEEGGCMEKTEAEGSTPSELLQGGGACEGDGIGSKGEKMKEEARKTKEEGKERKEKEKEKENEERIWAREARLREERKKRVTINGREVWGEGGTMDEIEDWIGGLLGRKVKVERVEENGGGQGGRFRIIQLATEEDANELCGMRQGILKMEGVEVDRDLTFIERRNRWNVRDKIREERKAGNKVVEEGEGWLKVTGWGDGEEVEMVTRWWWNERKRVWENKEQWRVGEEGKRDGRKEDKVKGVEGEARPEDEKKKGVEGKAREERKAKRAAELEELRRRVKELEEED